MEIIERITIEEVRAAKPNNIYYGAKTCWWTHDPEHLGRTMPTAAELRRTAERMRSSSGNRTAAMAPFMEKAQRRAESRGLPCDPRGGVLFYTENIEAFFQAALSKPEHYGRHGLRAFAAAHHLNCVLSLSDPRPWCSPDWLEYNEALDALDERNRR